MDKKPDLHTEFSQIGKDMDLGNLNREIKATAIKGGLGLVAILATAAAATYVAVKTLSEPKP